ncbi:MAG: response regulator, partial [Lachnospiraceae bacterium]|nr:response regulator [Lachnospiraceae bacterium]
EQFENIIRPCEHSTVYEAICRRLKLDPKDPGRSEDAKRRVLVVDDNAVTLRSIKALLDSDYEVSVATSGMKAMTSIGKARPDVILLDYEMPVCDGRQTLEMIRADEELKDIPVIFLTGVSDREHIEAVLGLKPSGYLLKPPVKSTLLEAIKKALSLT